MSLIIELKDDRSEKVRYNFLDYPAYIRFGILSQYQNYAAISHWHDDVEFIAVLSGKMLYNINGDIVELNDGDGIFVNSRQLHYGFSNDHTECEFICVLLHPLLLCSTQSIEQEYVTPIISNNSFSYWTLHMSMDWENNILDAVKQMYNCLNTSSPQLQIQSLFYQIWNILCEHAPQKQKQSNKRYHQLSSLKDMIGYIQKYYKGKISLDDIAIAGNVCKSKCCSVFRSYLNQTPISYLTDYRLKKSIDLMNSSDMSITEVSYEVGFSGASYYAETFHKQFGCSPSEYRMKYLGSK
jgi:AraC-like DNA-binding protein